MIVTMRIDSSNKHGEVRDCVDQRYIDFISKCGLIPILIPNSLKTIYMDTLETQMQRNNLNRWK